MVSSKSLLKFLDILANILLTASCEPCVTPPVAVLSLFILLLIKNCNSLKSFAVK